MKSPLFGPFFAPVHAAVLAATTLAAIAQPPVVATYEPPKDPTVLTSTFVDWDSLTIHTNANGESRAVFDNPTPVLDKLEVHITTLKPGMSAHPIHRHSWEEIILVKEGSLDVSINGQKRHAGPGYFIFYASNDPHNITNTGSTPATYYVINFVTGLSHATSEPGSRSESDKSAAELATPGKLQSTVIDCDSLSTTPSAAGWHVTVVDSPTLTFPALESHISTLNPGKVSAKEMVDIGDEVLIIKSGSVEVIDNGIASRMNAGSLLYWAPNDKRTLRNLGAIPTTYQVIRVISAKSPKLPTK